MEPLPIGKYLICGNSYNIGELAKGILMVKIAEKDRQFALKFIKE